MQCIQNINWNLLRNQKLTLLRLSDKASRSVSEDLDGIINLIDAIQDEAVGTDLATAEEVFGR